MRQVITNRAVMMADVPCGGSTGLLMVEYKGKESIPVYRVDTCNPCRTVRP
jgi:hypothetical protein